MINWLEQEAEFSLGRTSEISRDELKFQKFIDRLRKRFSKLFLEILKKQLILKGIITEEDWNSWKNDIVVDYIRDNHFTELKDAEMLRERIQTLETMKNAELISTYFSKQWVMKNVLKMTDDDIEDMKKQLDDEQKSGESGTEEEPQEESKIQNISLESQDETVDELEEERKILEIQTKEKELQVLENVAKSLASG